MLVLKKEIKQVLRRNKRVMQEVANVTGFKPDTVRRKCFKYDETKPTFLTQGAVLDLLAKSFGFPIESLTIEKK
jgi:hypothetical protein